ncbi:hypothetical protein V1525DRAFT_457934 [Lipomyces kononenkoae]|uniref:Uncharacterized protein n=1 Tax=Lipomyces kononenkoae TaxID=34357 RepID=A0ACC3SXY5_LIPKO
MVRPSRASFAAATGDDRDEYDPDVWAWIEAAGASGAVADQINRVLMELLDGGLDRPLLEPVLRGLGVWTYTPYSRISAKCNATSKTPKRRTQSSAQPSPKPTQMPIRRGRRRRRREGQRGREHRGGTLDGAHLTKPREFKGTKFDGQSKHLNRFLNCLELDF